MAASWTPLGDYPLVLKKAAVVDPLWRRALRWLAVGSAYAVLVTAVIVVAGIFLASGGDPAQPVSSALIAAVLLVLAGGIVFGLLAISVWLRPRAGAADVRPAPGLLVLYEWGVPRALTLPLTFIGYCVSGVAIVAGFEWGAGQLPGVSPWFIVLAGVVWIFAVILVVSLAFERVVLALRKRLMHHYPHRPLLVAGAAGLATPNWGPLGWSAVREVRLQWFTAGKHRFLMLAVDTVSPPAPDDPRSRWAHRYLHGDALIVDLRKSVMTEHEALAAVRAQRPAD